MSRRTTDTPTRGYGRTPWSRAVLAVIDRPDDTRRVNKARTYFRDRKVYDIRIRPGRVSALVQGSQVDPFETVLRTRTVEPETVVALLREQDATDDLLAVARGEQPRVLGAMVLPTESVDVVAECSCPDDEPRCIHVLAVAYEVAAQIDTTPSVALSLMGADVPTLLARMRDEKPEPTPQRVVARDRPAQPARHDFHTPAPLPALPTPSTVDVFADLDTAALGQALRMSGTSALDVAEATDELAELYARITGTPPD